MVRRGSPEVPASNDGTGHPKKSKADAATSSTASRSVPDDLVAEVLQWLPSRSLARLRCVCRSWNDLITSDGFLERYLQEAGEPTRHGPRKLVLAPLAKRHANSIKGLCRDCPRIVGARPCRGLVLFCRPCAMTYSVCNPSTGGLLHLPPCRRHWYVSSAGLGFHAPTKEYKVAQLAQLMNPRTWMPMEWQCRVLTVGDPRGWQEPSGEPFLIIPEYHCIDDDDPVLVNGRLHWTLTRRFLSDDYPQAQGILAFSLGDESFATVPLPPFTAADMIVYGPYGGSISNTDPYMEHMRPTWSSEQNKEIYPPAGTAMAELDGCLCMMRDLRLRADLDDMFEIWKLQDYESGAWSLDYRINLERHVAEPLVKTWLVVPLSYLGGGSDSSMESRKVLLTTTAHEAHVYDPETKTLQMVASMKDDDRSSCDVPQFMAERLRLVLYQESPVRFAGMGHHEDTIGYSLLSVHV